jgi:hypothetical protein
MELILQTTDGTPVKLKLIEFKDSINGDYFRIMKIEPLPGKVTPRPEWLTPTVIDSAKQLWGLHKEGGNDNMRGSAIKFLILAALRRGVMISVSEALNIFNEFCKT